ncbi:MAG: tetratricopeptide repeat protein [Acidobacteria bacterium]|nr:tetratricopeptide repeat protein [Acidobacteriota bacterium]
MKQIGFVFLLCIGLFGFAHAQKCPETATEVKPVLSDDTRKNYEAQLSNERTDYYINPDDANRAVWFGRRTAYLGEYKTAIKIYSDGIKANPQYAELYRHRGHRYITLRCFDDAVSDFEKAAKLIKGKPDQVEPDGQPNAKNIPTSTLQSNIWYHLGLAYYLKGDFKKALAAYKECQKVSKNNDMRVATAYWHYMTLRRLGKEKAAKAVLEPFAGEIELIENTDYLKLIKLNRGEVKAEDLLSTIRGDANTLGSASLGYGIGNYFLYNGDKEKAVTIFKKISAGDQWASFGFIAAEAELKRL